MLDNVRYQNHQNEEIIFGKETFLNKNEIRDYSWKYDTDFNSISNFYKGVISKKMSVVILANTEEEGTAKKNKLFEVFEKDVLAGKPGKLFVNGYYFQGYITESKKSNYLISRRLLYVEVNLSSDNPFWIRPTTFIYRAEEYTQAVGVKMYAYDYPYDYGNGLAQNNILNNFFMPCNFKMIIYGPCLHPTIYIAGNAYAVDTDIYDREYLTIDSSMKTIMRTKKNGELISEFNARDKEHYIFEKIPPGSHIVSWSGSFGFDVILIEERSEPPWI